MNSYILRFNDPATGQPDFAFAESVKRREQLVEELQREGLSYNQIEVEAISDELIDDDEYQWGDDDRGSDNDEQYDADYYFGERDE
jgi:hypothetical protein